MTTTSEVHRLWRRLQEKRPELAWHIPLQPVPCPRPKVTRSGHAYMPKNYDTWRMAAASYLTPKPASVLEEKLFAVIYQGLPEPKAMTAMSAERGPIGDIDNFAKAALDLLTKTGGIWRDDRQVALLLTEKGFTLTNVGTWIALVPMSEVPPCLQLRSTSPTPTSFSVCCERTLT